MTRFILLALAVILVVPALRVSAEDGTVTAFAGLVPRSDRVIKGDLRFPDGTTASFVTRDGTWVTVEDHRTGEFYGFSGVIEKKDSPNFVVYRIKRLDLESSHVDQLTHPQSTPVVGPRGPFVALGQSNGVAVRVTGIGEWSFATPAGLDPSQYTASELQVQYASGNGVCCVTCDSRTICANSVTTFCGNCSAGGGGAG